MVFVTVIVSSDSSISTPNALHASIVALVSLERRIFFIILLPSDNAARKTPLCV